MGCFHVYLLIKYLFHFLCQNQREEIFRVRSRWPTLWEASRTLGRACLRNILLKHNILWCWDEACPLIQIAFSLGHSRPLFCYCVCVRVQMGNKEKKLTPLKFDKREKILWLVDVTSLDMVDLAIVNSQIANNESPQIFIFVNLYSNIIYRPFHKSKKWVWLLATSLSLLPSSPYISPLAFFVFPPSSLPQYSIPISPFESLSLSTSISLCIFSFLPLSLTCRGPCILNLIPLYFF